MKFSSSVSFPAWVAASTVAFAVLCSSVWSAEQDALSRLDQALTGAAAFEYGKDSAPLQQVETLVFESSNDPALRQQVEARLLKSLGSTASRDFKEFICRQLFTVGTERSVPQLEQLLTDPALAHIARYALGRNESPAACAALLRALPNTSGKVQAGILDTLGQRRYQPAFKEIQTRVGSSDPHVAEAAAVALGQLGTAEAAKVLQAASSKASPGLRRRINEALLICAGHLLADGQTASAARVYSNLYSSSEITSTRLAALRGLLASGDGRAIEFLSQAIKGTDEGLARVAIGLAPEAKGAKATIALAQLLTGLSSDKQVLLLKGLAARKDSAAIAAVSDLAGSSNAEVRLAAVETIGVVGNESQVNLLIRAAANSTGKEQQVARLALIQIGQNLSNSPVTRALLASAVRAAPEDPKTQVEAIRALASRRSTSAVPQLLEVCSSSQVSVRREALRALGMLAGTSQLEAFAEIALGLQESQEMEVFEQAFASALQRVKSPEDRAKPLLNALAKAPDVKQPPLISLLAHAATPASLGAAQHALASENPQVRSAALRALSEWPDPAPADVLLSQVQSAASPVDKVVALRGYIRLAGLAKDPGSMYARALQLAERPEDKRLVLSGLASAEPAQALELIKPFFKNEQLRNEAAQAAVQIADRLRVKDPVQAKAIAKEALAACTEEGIRQKGQEVVNQIEEFEGYILEWVGGGPFQAEGKDAHALFDMVFPPEQPGSAFKWSKISRGVGAWDINLGDAIGGGDDITGYLSTRVFSPASQEARLELGSDDGIKVWLNGKVVHANNTERGIAPRQDVVKITLNEGWNTLLIKVTNRAGGWNAACRVRQPDGSAIAGLKVDPQ